MLLLFKPYILQTQHMSQYRFWCHMSSYWKCTGKILIKCYILTKNSSLMWRWRSLNKISLMMTQIQLFDGSEISNMENHFKGKRVECFYYSANNQHKNACILFKVERYALLFHLLLILIIWTSRVLLSHLILKWSAFITYLTQQTTLSFL